MMHTFTSSRAQACGGVFFLGGSNNGLLAAISIKILFKKARIFYHCF